MIALLAMADAVQTAGIVAAGGVLTALIVGWQSQRSKREDYKRQDDVAKALREENKRVADEAFRQQAEVAAKAAEQQQQVADVAKGAAKLLADAQETTKAGTDEVARLQAGDKSGRPFQTGRLLAVVISHPSGLRREILLDAVPRVGEHVLLRGVEHRQPSKVADVLYVEANNGSAPSVIVVVCPPEKGDEMSLKEVRTLKDDL